MTSNLTPFVFDDALVRVRVDERGAPWFVAKDVCRVLGIEKYRDAIATLDDDEKGCPVLVDTLGGEQQMSTVSESGLYSLVFRSRKPEARVFRKWVTAEVLPAIRRTGAYGLPAELPDYATRLRPQVRSNVLNAVMQAARLTNITRREEIDALFLHYCRLVGEGPAGAPVIPGLPVGPDMAEEQIRCFAEEGLEYAYGCRILAGKLYHAFVRWWQARHAGTAPTQHRFGAVLKELYPKYKRGGIVYYGNVTWRVEGDA